jgi:hypothetical protein
LGLELGIELEIELRLELGIELPSRFRWIESTILK